MSHVLKPSSGDSTQNLRLGETSDQALETARFVRGSQREPAIIIHGVTQRSGTGYVDQLLRLHPDLVASPNDIWEVPFLQFTDRILDFQERFFEAYPYNVGRIGENDFLPLFGSSFIAYLYSFMPEGKRMLIKVPSVKHLECFYWVFPYENLLVLMRDGRDVVSSTVRTWPEIKFADACRRWEHGARMVLCFHERYSGKRTGYWLGRYEDATRSPEAFVRTACKHFGLDPDKYPFDEVKNIPVVGSSSLKKQGQVIWKPMPRPKDFKPIGRWRDWSFNEKRVFKRIAGQALLDAGYCDDLDW